MRKQPLPALIALSATLVALSSTGCHLLFPFDPRTEQVTQCYWLGAEIYRQLPGTTEEFTEGWFTYAWPDGQYANDPWGYLGVKCGEYIDLSVAPLGGMVWKMRNLQCVAVPYREVAVDCSNPSYLPHTFGGPYGASLRWNNPPSTEASVSISLTDKDGVYRHADPAVKTASIDVAERTGMPDWSAGGTYVRGKQHLRFADMFFEVATPFQLGSDITVNKCYLQSIGTVVAERVGTTYDYTIYPGNAKFFFYGNATKGGDTATTSFCFANSISQNVALNQHGPMTHFALALNLPSSVLGQNMTVQISLVKPYSQFSLFAGHQPVVTLLDKQADSTEVDLVPDDVVDLDGDLDKLMWIENFEASNERFLGTGSPLHVTLAPGSHEIALIAYDARGAYGTGIMTLTVPPPPANDDCVDATPIGAGWLLGTLGGASADGSASCGGQVTGQPNTESDAWYRYTAPVAGTLKVSTCGTHEWGGPDAGMDTVLSLHSGCPGTTANQLACNDDWPNGSDPTACNLPWPFFDLGTHRDSAVALPVTKGQTVFIRVSKYKTSRPGVFYLLLGLYTGVASDLDHDGDVDLSDFLSFQACFNGPNRPYAQPNCADADLDHDNDVDLKDFLTFQGCFNGPNRPAKCP
jgi:hypothetical protein